MVKEIETSTNDNKQLFLARESIVLNLNSQRENAVIVLSNQENEYYKELLQKFFRYLERWRTVVSTREYSIEDALENYALDRRWKWGVDIVQYKNTMQLVRIRNTGIKPRSSIARVTSLADYDITDSYSSVDYTLAVEPLRKNNRPLIDPYTETPLYGLNFAVGRYHDLEGKGESIVRDDGDYIKFEQGINYQMRDTVSIFAYYTPIIGISPAEFNGSRVRYVLYDGKYFGRDADNTVNELMSDEHVMRLFELVDSLIPQANPQLPLANTISEK